MKTNTPTDNTSELSDIVAEIVKVSRESYITNAGITKTGVDALQAYISKKVREELETLRQTEFNRNAMGDITSLEEVLDARLAQLTEDSKES